MCGTIEYALYRFADEHSYRIYKVTAIIISPNIQNKGLHQVNKGDLSRRIRTHQSQENLQKDYTKTIYNSNPRDNGSSLFAKLIGENKGWRFSDVGWTREKALMENFGLRLNYW